MGSKLRLPGPLPLLAIAILSLFWPALISPHHILFPTFSGVSDVMVIHWPKARLMAQSWQAGDGRPHWSPLILSGMPLAANQLAMLAYPPAWLFLFLPPEPVFNFLFIFHLLLGGVGVYFLLHRAHRLSAGAALLGGLTFALNGKWLAHVAGGHVSLVGAIAWLPWALFGLMRLLDDRPPEAEASEDTPPTGSASLFDTLISNSGWVLLTAAALAMQAVTHTQLLIYTAYLLATVTAWRLLCVKPRCRRVDIKRLFLPLLAIPLLAGLLAAAQLLPLLELARFSNRALSLNQAGEFALSPAQLLVGLLLPTAQGGHEPVIYLGLVPLLLAPFGVARKNRWTWFYGGLLVFAALFALGPHTPLFGLVYRVLPGFRWVRTPARMFFIGAMGLAGLVGFGVDRLTRRHWSPAAKQWLTRTAVAAGGGALLMGLGLAFGFGQANRAALGLAGLVPAGTGLILLRVQRRLSVSVATTLLGLLLFLDLASFDLSLVRFVSPEEALSPGQAAAGYLAQTSEHGRIYSPSYSLPPPTAAAAGLRLADGVEPVHLSIYDQFMARAGGYADPGFSVTIPNFGDGSPESALRETEPNLKLLGLLNVTHLASAFPMNWPGLTPEAEIEGIFIYRNELAQPRAWVAHQTVPAQADPLAQLEHLPDASSTVIIETGPLSESSAPASPATITRYAPDAIDIETKIDAPGRLVVSEIWYPGWQATVNGRVQPVDRVNGLLRGVYLSRPGAYKIRLEYRPRSVILGNWVSGFTAGLVILAGLWRGAQLLYCSASSRRRASGKKGSSASSRV